MFIKFLPGKYIYENNILKAPSIFVCASFCPILSNMAYFIKIDVLTIHVYNCEIFLMTVPVLTLCFSLKKKKNRIRLG